MQEGGEGSIKEGRLDLGCQEGGPGGCSDPACCDQGAAGGGGGKGAHPPPPQCILTGVHVQVGMSTGLTARVAWKFDKRTTLHSSARMSVVGGPSQVELGARYRWGRLTSTGLAVAYGTQVCSCALCPALCPALCSALCPALCSLWCPQPLPCPALPCPAPPRPARPALPCPALPCPAPLCVIPVKVVYSAVFRRPLSCYLTCTALCLPVNMPCPVLPCHTSSATT